MLRLHGAHISAREGRTDAGSFLHEETFSSSHRPALTLKTRLLEIPQDHLYTLTTLSIQSSSFFFYSTRLTQSLTTGFRSLDNAKERFFFKKVVELLEGILQ